MFLLVGYVHEHLVADCAANGYHMHLLSNANTPKLHQYALPVANSSPLILYSFAEIKLRQDIAIPT